ncbi:hypothetical protein R1sor_018460 [Riccia sorocarpa]|uniref:Uncharacterized protein n=1 Tax=Riccia sorocarpa TaxID=122646 RepID=A0ABD3I9R2_9MARC
MAKVADVRRIVLPVPSAKFKVVGNGQANSSKDSSGAVKVDSGSDSKMSWANQVEEEHGATDRTEDSGVKVQGENGTKDDDGSGKKSKKKKKKKSKAGTAAEEESPGPVDNIAEDPSKSSHAEKQPSVELEISDSLSNITGESRQSSSQHTGKVADVVSRNKPRNSSATSGIAEEQKVASAPKVKGSNGSSLPSAAARDFPNGNKDPQAPHSGFKAESRDSGWEVVATQKNRRGQETGTRSSDSKWNVPPPSTDFSSANWDSGWEGAGSQKGRRGAAPKPGRKPADLPIAYSNDYVPPPPANGGWDDDLPSNYDPSSNWNSGWEANKPQTANVPTVYRDDFVPPPSSNGNRDDDLLQSEAPPSNFDSGWEVAGSRRKKGDEHQQKPLGAAGNGAQRSKGRGQQLQAGNKFNDQMQRGNKQRLGESEKVIRGRSAGNIAQDKSGRPSPRNTGKGEGAVSHPSSYQQTAPSPWSKPNSKLTHSSSNLSTASLSGSQNSSAASTEKSASRVGSTGILGNLFPAERGYPEENRAVEEPTAVEPPADDAWKGGFPAFAGSTASFDDYPGSDHSDSVCSDDDFDSDTMSIASYDSAESYKSHGTQKKNKWFKNFFQELDTLTDDQLQEHDRQWHCPACQNGVGAIDWYRGLQPLLAHAKTVRSKRVKLHKNFAEVLEEEIRIRGAAPGTHGSGKYGRWKGLNDEHNNQDTPIVWPPMVVIRNTQLEQDESEKWLGMGNKELLDLFKTHNPVKARHSYGPQGHRGISILIFSESPTGYYDAQRLDKHFKDVRRGRDNWNTYGKPVFQPGGDRILYGYIATPDDLEVFNKHSRGKQNLKWEQRSLQEMVLIPMRKMGDENKKVAYLQGQVQREMAHSKTLKKTMSVMMKKLHMREDELRVIRERAREQYQLQETEMADMESLYKSKIEQLKQEILEKEAGLQKVHEDYEQEHLDQCEQLEQRVRKIPKDELSDELKQQKTLVEEELAKHTELVERCIKRQEEWEAQKVQLQKEHHRKLMEFRSRQWQELLAFAESLEEERMTMMNSFKSPSGN